MGAKLKSKHPTFAERLDAAVREAFPTVDCETSWSIFTMRLHSRWWMRGTETDQRDGMKCPHHLARQVRAFVRGFSACEESQQEPTK